MSHHKPRATRPAEHVFRLDAPDAERVAVTGSFCAWDPDCHLLKKHRDGHWETHLPLAHGRHEYRFVVDGTWVNDPAGGETVPTPFGSTNNVVDV